MPPVRLSPPQRFVANELKTAFRFAPARPAVALGVRALLATLLPMVVGLRLGSASSLWGILGGYNATLVDKGGAYPARAAAMAGITLAGAAAAVLAALCGEVAAAAIPAMFVWVTVCSFADVYGDTAGRVGRSAAVVFAISLGAPVHSSGDALLRGVWLAGGGAWAMLLGLALWPVRVYRPARRAVAACFEALAAQATRLARGLEAGGDWSAAAIAHHAKLREAIEVARATLSATRRGRLRESGRGARLHMLVEVADEIFGGMSALTGVASGVSTPPLVAELARGLDELAERLRELAPRVRTEKRVATLPPPRFQPASLAPYLDAAALDPIARAEHGHAAELLGRILGATEAAAAVVATLHDDSPLPEGSPPLGLAEGERRTLDPIWQNLTPRSASLRHALRVGVTASLATALTHALALQRGYWVTLTVILLLQPHAPATLTRSIQRVAGTVAGGLLAALIATVLREQTAVLVVVLALAAVSTAVLNLNYALFATLLTPTFVLLAEVSAGDWRLAGVRIENTLIGAALAIASAWLLWPSWERDHFGGRIAAVFTALRSYRGEVEASFGGGAEPALRIAAARRRLGLALGNAEASFDRILAESGGAPLEPPMTLLFYARRVGAALGALATARGGPTTPAAAELAPLWREIDRNLAELEEAARTGRPPPSHAERDVAPRLPPIVRVRIDRLLEELEVLNRAAERWLDVSAGASEPPETLSSRRSA